MTGDSPRLVGYILARDEEHSIGRAVSSLRRVAETVVVVDSESTDRTTIVAHEHGAIVLVHPFEGFAAQRNWALDEIERRYQPEWVLALDADEWLDDKLVAEIKDKIARLELDEDVYMLRLRTRFSGQPLRWGGFARTRLPRLLRSNMFRYEAREVNEHLVIPIGARLGQLPGFLEHSDVGSWERYIAKHNHYSTLEAAVRHQRSGGRGSISLRDALRLPHLRRRFLRERVFNRLPARPALRFLQIYVFCGGALDGKAGFRRALFEAWQEMCTDLKYEALRRGEPS